MKISDAIRNVELVFMNFPDIASEETIESFEIAVAAMEKQDPMYARVPAWFHHSMNCACPACGETMEPEHNYCPNCGQAIDWSEE